jgi:hypothetical protein
MIDIIEIHLNISGYIIWVPVINGKRFCYIRRKKPNTFWLEYEGKALKVKLEDLNNSEIEYLRDFVLALQLEYL